jgi:hypothetical protein
MSADGPRQLVVMTHRRDLLSLMWQGEAIKPCRILSTSYADALSKLAGRSALRFLAYPVVSNYFGEP